MSGYGNNNGGICVCTSAIVLKLKDGSIPQYFEPIKNRREMSKEHYDRKLEYYLEKEQFHDKTIPK